MTCVLRRAAISAEVHPLLLVEIADGVDVEAASVLACCAGADRDARLAEPPPNDRGGGPVVPGDPLAGHSLVEVEPAQLDGGRRRRRSGMRRWDQRTGHAQLAAAVLHPPRRDPETGADLGVVEPKVDVEIGQRGGVNVQARDASAAGRPQGIPYLFRAAVTRLVPPPTCAVISAVLNPWST